MKAVFADTLFWIARARPRDTWRAPARKALKRLGKVRLVTTDEVLVEFLTALRDGGPILRRKAVETIRLLLQSPDVTVVPQSHESFLRALDRYAVREDKAYSLTDCASMNAMDAQGIQEVLTNDHHFEQEGYTVLIKV
jgi:predicted nucleic acid-binding protein